MIARPWTAAEPRLEVGPPDPAGDSRAAPARAWLIRSRPVAAADGWKAGTGKVAITPQRAVWMAGYGAPRPARPRGRSTTSGPRPSSLEDPRAEGAARHARPLRDRRRRLAPSATPSRRDSGSTRPDRPGLLAHPLRAGRRQEPDHDVPARRRPARAGRRRTRRPRRDLARRPSSSRRSSASNPPTSPGRPAGPTSP